MTRRVSVERASFHRPLSFTLQSHGSYDLNEYFTDACVPFKSQLNEVLEKKGIIKVKVHLEVIFVEDREVTEGLEWCEVPHYYTFTNNSEWIDYAADLENYYQRCVVQYMNDRIREVLETHEGSSLHSDFSLIVFVSDLHEEDSD